MRRPHDPLVVDGHVHKELIKVDILLGVRSDQVVERMAGDSEYRRTIQLGVVEAVQQVDSPGPDVARQTPSLPVYLA